jgi:ABC-type spermidine/putrescine transport system permease subunit II
VNAHPYPFHDKSNSSFLLCCFWYYHSCKSKCDWWCAASRAVLIGIVTGSVLLVVGLTLVAFYAVHQKKRAQRLVSINDPFGDALY